MKIILALLLACLSASAQLVINNQVACVAAGISGQPTSLENLTNVAQTLTVTASGTTPYAYQWHLGTDATNALAGATTSSYSYTNQTAVTNSYCAVVTNACGAITSSVATLSWTNGAAPSWSPSDLTNLQARWVVSTGWSTNGGMFTLADSGSNAWNLTNSVRPTLNVGTLNGHDWLHFNGTSDYLRNVSFTNSMGWEIWMVVRYWDVAGQNAAGRFIFDSVNGSYRETLYEDPRYVLYADGVTNPNGQCLTNKWCVITAVFATDKSVVRTNDVECASPNTFTAKTTSGFTLGSRYGLDSGRFGAIDIAEMWTCSSTNSVANRNLCSNYCFTTYGLSQ